jgi:Putative MetA-pathway of phenol degradation
MLSKYFTFTTVISRLGAWIFILLFGMPFTAMGADDSPQLTTDRPSQSDASTLVPPGYLQSEIGYTYTRDDTAGTTTNSHSAPNLLLRYGLLDELEIRFGWNGYFRNNPNPGAVQEGSGDGQVSAKLYLRQESGWLPETTLLAGTTLPFGKNAFLPEEAIPFSDS